ncbi:MAG: response regulator, partial [Hyphomicrobiales bacterium]|nr:response regulator [Hyphomicrobiales bacterium]
MEASAANEVALPLSGARLIVVEDDFLILMELESALADAGAKIVGSCRTLDAAMSLVEADGLAAAILDIRLGRDTVEPAARRLAERGIPFIFYTGQSET